MAHYAKYLYFLLVIVLALNTEARESKFFTKVIRDSSTNNVNQISETPLLAPAPAPEPESAAPLKTTEYGYGLYGHESTEFPPTKTTTTTTSDFENVIPTEQLSSTESYKEYNTGGDTYNNNGGYNYYNNNNNNNGYASTYNYNNNGYTNGYNNNGYGTEKKGMSDTKFLNGGQYFYDVKSENYNGNGRYDSVKENGNNEKYYGNSENPYEFNTMEEYERQQGYPVTQEVEGYVP